MKDMPIGICQLQSRFGSEDYDPRPDNLQHALAAIDKADALGAKILVFGEAYLNGYESDGVTWKYAVSETPDDPFVGALVDEAARRRLYLVIGATTTKGSFPGDVFNSAIVVGPAGLLGVYSKAHVCAYVDGDDIVFKEKVYWSPGQALPIFETEYGRIGVEICYDIWFPEVARTLTLKGAELIINVSAAVRGFETSWDHVLYTRSRENAVWYLHVSVVGRQREYELFGGSRLFSPVAEVICEAPRGEEAVMLVTAPAEMLHRARATLHPFSNRNPRLYQPITASDVSWTRN
jgi:predicted amidohydrolase